jgi:nucleolar MIF4G domain-containing protein 1
VVSSYETHHSALQGTSQPLEAITQVNSASEVLGKECSNLIVLLSELYNFQVISSVLVFDIIRDLLDQKLTEFNVELLLKIVRSESTGLHSKDLTDVLIDSGQQLRQDDPLALKDIVGIVQTKVSNQDDSLRWMNLPPSHHSD